MPTYDQLNAESWWRNEVITDEMAWLGRELCAGLGVGRDHFGVRGDNSYGHLSGGHRSQAWILNSRWCTDRSYTVEVGLPAANVNDVPAFDITPASREQMIAMSKRLDAATRSGQLEELVVWYGTVDGNRVVGWDNIRNALASSDESHLWHVHGQLARRLTRSRTAVEKVAAVLLGRPLGDDMAVSDAEKKQLLDAAASLIWEVRPWLETLSHAEEARAAADEARDRAMLTAIQALTAGGSVEAAPIIAAIRQAATEAGATARAQAQQITDLRRDLAAAQRAAADKLA